MERKKRILIFVTLYIPHLSGLTIYAQRLAEGLIERGHRVTVVTARFDKQLKRRECLNGVEIIRLWSLIRVSRGFIMPTLPVISFILTRQCDIVNVHIPMLEAALIGIYAKLWSKKLIITHHVDLILPKRNIFSLFIEFCLFNSYKITVIFANKVVSYTQDYFSYSRYLKITKNKFLAIYPFIKIPSPEKNSVEKLREVLKLRDNKVIGFFGRFVEEKRPDLLIKALPLILDKIPNVRLIFVGKNKMIYEKFYEYCSPLIKKFKDYIIFVGEISNPGELAAYYSLCDLIVLPSERESFGIVQVESMLCGTPVVAADLLGARVPVKVTGMGELALPLSIDDLSNKIIRVLLNKEKYVLPRETIEKIFNFNNSISKYEQIFEKG